jgi:hypothetical protein
VLLLQRQSEERQVASDMVEITASYTLTKGGAASAAVLRGGGGSRVLSVGEEDKLVRQALRMLMAGDGAGDSEAGKVSLSVAGCVAVGEWLVVCHTRWTRWGWSLPCHFISLVDFLRN